MNAELLEDEEIVRITNEKFVAINRNDLGGMYDIKLNISTAEADEQKGSELFFASLPQVGHLIVFFLFKRFTVLSIK